MARRPAVNRALDRVFRRVVGCLWRRGLFVVRDTAEEQRRLDLLRVALGLVACWSAAGNLATVLPGGDAVLIGARALALALAALLLLGLATPLAAGLYGALLNLQLDNVGGWSNLGSMVLAICLFVCAFAPTGRTLSVDALLMRRPGPLGAALRGLYRAWGPLTPERAALVRLCALAAYAAITFHAALLHLESEEWRRGAANAWLLLSPRANAATHELADAAYRAAPAAYVFFSRVSTWGTLLWEVTILPFALLSRPTRAFTIGWGLLFFFAGATILPVGMLGWYELVLWAQLFWCPRRMPLPARAWGRVRFGPTSPRSAPPTASPASASSRLASPVLAAVVLTFATFLLAFAVRLPYVRELPLAREAAELSRRFVGQAPLALGIGPVDVYNDVRDAAGQFPVRSWWTDGARVVPDLAARPWLDPSDELESRRHFRRMARAGIPCGDAGLHDYLARFGERYAPFVMPSGAGEDVRYVAAIDFADWPSFADLDALRYHHAPATEVCRLTLVVGSGRRPSLEVTERGAALIAREAGLPFVPAPSGAPLLFAYPCAAEVERIGWWFDRPQLAARGPEALGAVRALVADVATKHPARCFAEAEAVLDHLDLDWGDAGPPAGASCAADLRLAAALADPMVAAEGEGTAAAALERARAADARGDPAGCLLATAEVRRAYVNALRGA